MGDHALTKADFKALSELRYQIRHFLRFSEQAVRSAGLTPLQYALLLQLRGFPGRDWATITELAERLQAQRYGTVALVQHCARHGLIVKRTGRLDRRQVEVSLAPQVAQCLKRLALLHRAYLRALRDAFAVARLSEYQGDDASTAARMPPKTARPRLPAKLFRKPSARRPPRER